MTAELRIEIEQRLEILTALKEQRWDEYKAALALEECKTPPPSESAKDKWYKLLRECDALEALLRTDLGEPQSVEVTV